MFDKATKRLGEIAIARPPLEGRTLSPVKPITYTAADGTQIPAYLTLPVGSSGKNLPAIVMPHGGPSARDEWGFDWLAQFYAAQGFAVIQPNFRGSAGYGEGWFVENGFKSWRVAIGDVNDAGRWLVREGIANPAKLAIVGWSYGGYAALQSGVTEPALFRAIVAIAPVTDLRMLIDQSAGFTNSALVARFVGSGEHVASGSPRQHAGKITAPVLMFSGDQDLNVDISHSREMDQALRAAGKRTELIVYKGLDHSIVDSGARADMLQRSLDFLNAALK
jgi:dipeptidyl aminopeptidase/acylaminoacyl peptidase